MNEKKPTSNPQASTQNQTWWPWAGGLGVLLLLALLWIPVSRVGASTAELRAWIEPLGPLAPVVFVLLNVAQILVAPIPGYPVQILGGVLFGFVPGAIYAVGGMVAGGTLAAWLGRRLGRPWLEGRVGPEALAHWGEMAHINSFWTWWMLLLIPLGDLPYFFAGLSKIRLSSFALAILTSRGPFTALVVLLGDRGGDLPLGWLAVGVGAVVLIGFSQRGRLEAWGRRYLRRRAGDPH